jgi:hypothetical protein
MVWVSRQNKEGGSVAAAPGGLVKGEEKPALVDVIGQSSARYQKLTH